jgi:hypothetical protein
LLARFASTYWKKYASLADLRTCLGTLIGLQGYRRRKDVTGAVRFSAIQFLLILISCFPRHRKVIADFGGGQLSASWWQI